MYRHVFLQLPTHLPFKQCAQIKIDQAWYQRFMSVFVDRSHAGLNSK